MYSLNLNQPILYKHASFRFFDKNEHHIKRHSVDNVLLMVYEGVLRFTEDGIAHEVGAGEYYIQRKGLYQSGDTASNAPKYLYVHFDGDWTDERGSIPTFGKFESDVLFPLMERMDRACHSKADYCEQEYIFLKLLLSLRKEAVQSPLKQKLTDYVEKNSENIHSLADICNEFHYSKNYVIRIFKKELGASPLEYINEVKMNKAMYLIKTTSQSIDEIARNCGWSDYSYFYKRFVKRNHVSPLRWRKMIREYPMSD